MIVEAPAMRAPLHGAQPQGTASDNRDDRRGLDRRQSVRDGRPETRHADAAAHHAERDGPGLREHRHNPFLEGHHQFGQSADVGILEDGRAVGHVGDGHQVVGADCA
jgi:hypothetical protein